MFKKCQWPFNDPQNKDFYFCEDKAVEGKPYCQKHCDIAYLDEKEIRDKKNKKVAA